MNWHFLLTSEEHELYEYHIEAYLHNTPGFVWMNFIGYVICTLLFFDHLTFTAHLILGAWALGFAMIAHLYAYARQIGQFVPPSINQGIKRVVLIGLIWMLWWCAYFYALAQEGDEVVLQQFIIIQAMVVVISIAMVGRFQRVAIINLFVLLVFITFLLSTKKEEFFERLLLQVYLLSLAELMFLHVLNRQLFDLFRVKNLNTELVDALKQKNVALEQANLAQSRYLSAASHDLRQPLHALALLTSDAQRKNSQPEVSTTLGKIEQAIDSLSTSFNAMLNLSRLDAGVVKPDLQLIPLQRIFERIQVEFEETARQKDLTLVIVPSKVWVRSDEGMLHSILSNFISNAVRYTERGKILLGVRRGANHKVKIVVIDTGTGVPTEKAKQIFQEYQRLEYAEQRVKGGVGLGLAISERMAKLLEMQLFVQSVPSKGSCFGIVTHAVPQSTAQEVRHKEREAIGDYLTGKRIAILDDDETAVDYLAELLGSWGLNVSVVLSSDMFRELVAEEGAFDVILSDFHLGLSDETGLDVLIKARAVQADSPPICILITGDTTSELAQAVRQHNVQIVYKPLSPVRLRAYLNTVLHTR